MARAGASGTLREPGLEALRCAAAENDDAVSLSLDVRSAASGLEGGSAEQVIHRRKGLAPATFVRTHGLPDPDGPLHKGSIFLMLLAPLRPGRMLDLGAGKGNFSLSAMELGWDVTTVDARTVRWPDADTEPDADVAARIRSIHWIQADVRTFPLIAGDFDLIRILELLHLLELTDQIDLIRRCSGTLLLLDTRIAPARLHRQDNSEGRVVKEHGETLAKREQVATAARGNAVSFRHTEESLLRLLRDGGYAQVMPMRPPHRRDYTFYLGYPNPRQTPAKRQRQARSSRSRAQRELPLRAGPFATPVIASGVLSSPSPT